MAAETGVALVIISFLKGTSPGDAREWKEADLVFEIGLWNFACREVGARADLERLEETLEIMSDAATMNRLAESDVELARGEHVSAEELAEVMRQRRHSEQGRRRSV